MLLTGKTAIITGSGSGIGQGIAERLGSEGANVVVDYNGSADGAEQTRGTIEKAGGKALIFQADVTVPEQTQALVDAAWQHFGSADILVNNAGVEKRADFWDVTQQDYDLVLNVNLRGPFFLTQAFVRRLMAAGKPGRIINISSVHEDMAFPHFTSYCITKGGLRMMTRNLAVELAPSNILINNVAPGAIATPINQKLMQDKSEMDSLLKNIPLGHMGSVSDVASLVAFLAGDNAGYITGSTYVVDGGLMRSYHEQ